MSMHADHLLSDNALACVVRLIENSIENLTIFFFEMNFCNFFKNCFSLLDNDCESSNITFLGIIFNQKTEN